jgi:CheY-like chemotaxis protein
LGLLLSLLGHRVELAADGVEGVRKALTLHPDVAIVDLRLPRLDGYQVAERLRASLGKSVVLLAFSAYDADDTGERVNEAGFDAHVVKTAGPQAFEPWLRGVAQDKVPSPR